MDGRMITVIFSKDRSLQLDATLRSLYLNCDEYLDIHVLYTCSNERHENSYKNLEKKHKFVKFVREIDFKADLLKLIHDKMYILFVVDDTVFTKKFSAQEIIDTLDINQDAIGFSLRLGINTTNCYTQNKPQIMPPSVKIIMYGWIGADYDFGYPLELSSTIMRIDDISPVLQNLPYNNPNELEWMMYCALDVFKKYKPLLLCYQESVAFSLPLNKVQTTNNNRNSELKEYNPDLLLTKYEKCGILNVEVLQGFIPNGAHQEVEIEITYNDK
jgi:hypothetical protein